MRLAPNDGGSVNLRKIIRNRLRDAMAIATVVTALAAPSAAPVRAASVSPRVLEAARGTPEEAAVRERVARYARSKSAGVDRLYPQFALDLAKYPRGGLA